MALVTVVDRPIRVYAPLKGDDRYAAIIDHFDIVFYGPSPMAAEKAARDWAKAEYERVTSKAQREANARSKRTKKAPDTQVTE